MPVFRKAGCTQTLLYRLREVPPYRWGIMLHLWRHRQAPAAQQKDFLAGKFSAWIVVALLPKRREKIDITWCFKETVIIILELFWIAILSGELATDVQVTRHYSKKEVYSGLTFEYLDLYMAPVHRTQEPCTLHARQNAHWGQSVTSKSGWYCQGGNPLRVTVFMGYCQWCIFSIWVVPQSLQAFLSRLRMPLPNPSQRASCNSRL